jgi:pSer/pThr/pTyr-binding forkhead associated (FHA) protein
MKARLAAYRDGKLQATYPLPEPGTTIGRDEENHVRLDHTLVSRRHCAIHAKDGMWVIKDLESTNGTEVNGTFIGNAVLKTGDAIGIGPFYLIFEIAEDGADWGPTQLQFVPTARRRPDGGEIRPAPQTMPIKDLRKPGSDGSA